MRTIKFRVFNKKTNKWIHGPHEREDLDGVNILGENIILGNIIGDTSIEDLNEIEVLQYTGFKDKNGRNIFEGDILKIPDEELGINCVNLAYVHVWFSENSGSWTISYNHMYSEVSSELCQYNRKYEVVGNIFDNLDLIK